MLLTDLHQKPAQQISYSHLRVFLVFGAGRIHTTREKMLYLRKTLCFSIGNAYIDAHGNCELLA